MEKSITASKSSVDELRVYFVQPSFGGIVREFNISDYTDDQINQILQLLDSAPNRFHTHVKQLGLSEVLP